MTDQQKVEFEAQGYLVLENALDAATLDNVSAAFDSATDLANLPNHDPIFIHLADHAGFFPLVHQIIGDVVQLRSVLGERTAPGNTGQDWHKETAGMLGVHQPLSTVAVGVLIHLDNTAKEGTSLSVVPASHRFRPDLPIPVVSTTEEMPHQVSLDVASGSAILAHANIWQARTPYRSDHPHRFLSYTYNHCWMRQALPDLSSDSRDIVAASHNLSQLFGIGPDVDQAPGYWSRKVEGYPSSSGLPERKFAEFKVVGRGVQPNR